MSTRFIRNEDIIYDLRPALIIETGTWYGGSALFFACLMDMMDHGRVISIDLEPMPIKYQHNRISYIKGDSVDPEVVEEVRKQLPEEGPVIVILDSDQSAEHVAKELELYHGFVTPRSLLLVEDTNISDKPVSHSQYPGGPYPAVQAFLKEHPEFYQDIICEHYILTMHPGGWLRRKDV